MMNKKISRLYKWIMCPCRLWVLVAIGIIIPLGLLSGMQLIPSLITYLGTLSTWSLIEKFISS